MRYLLNTAGLQEVTAAIAQQPLLAFDFDGTLAPIVPVPDNAYAPMSVSTAMRRLCAIAPVAIVTGRSIDDVSARLAFEPKYIIGNHGAEGMAEVDTDALDQVMRQWLAQFEAGSITLPEGVTLERKRFSLSLHYRLARDRDAAQAAVLQLAQTLQPLPDLIGGKCVLNLLPPGAPNKFSAIQSLLLREGRSAAVFVGDDETDEIAFREAPPSWLTVRVEHADHSAARFYLGHQSEMAHLIQIIEEQWRAAFGPR